MGWIPLIANIVGFKIVWLGSVLGGAEGLAWLGPVLLVLFAGLQIHFISGIWELKLMLLTGLIGLLVDSGYIWAGLVVFDTPEPVAGLAPIWIIAMWMNFSLLLNHSLSWLKQHLLLGAAFGAVGGPLAYFAGMRLGAAEIVDPVKGFVVISIAWALAVPVCLLIARQLHNPAAIEPAA